MMTLVKYHYVVCNMLKTCTFFAKLISRLCMVIMDVNIIKLIGKSQISSIKYILMKSETFLSIL